MEHGMLVMHRLPRCDRSQSHALELMGLSVSHTQHTLQVGDLAAASTSAYLSDELCNKMWLWQ